jgi:4'-phosphopantetheinyl transferase EntD
MKGRVHQEMWRLLFTQTESEYLESLSHPRQDVMATTFFSLKEAYYKLQYPLTGVFLDFPEVEIIVAGDDLFVKLLRHVNAAFAKNSVIQGYALQHNDHVVTYCTLPAIN